MIDTFLDGGGVIADQPLGEGVWIRFHPTGNPEEDIRVAVVDGVVHAVGMWRMIDTRQTALNALDVITLALPINPGQS